MGEDEEASPPRDLHREKLDPWLFKAIVVSLGVHVLVLVVAVGGVWLIAAVAGDPLGGLLALPVSDTLKFAGRDGRSERTVPREGLWRALTPQMFRYGVLRRALALSIERQRDVTDEASAVEALGLRPRLVPGRAGNIKVTLPEGLALAAAIIAQGSPQGAHRSRLRRPRV